MPSFGIHRESIKVKIDSKQYLRSHTGEQNGFSVWKTLKRRRLRISRIDGQTRKIENPDNLPQEHLRGTIFENVIVIF